MSLIICLCDFWNSKTYFRTEKESKDLEELPEKPWRHLFRKTRDTTITTKQQDSRQNVKYVNSSNGGAKLRILRRLRIVVDGNSVFYLLRELEKFTEFRRRLCECLTLQQVQLLWIQFEQPRKQILDYKWNEMLAHTLREKIEVDYLMSWLSTLGGGYSALGEQFSRCAETAGKISLKQLALGVRLGDPFLQARCKLYYSISLIQTGRLRVAKHIVREQYKFAKKQKDIDMRLVNMCKGIWMRIEYEYGLRLKEKERRKQQQLTEWDYDLTNFSMFRSN